MEMLNTDTTREAGIKNNVVFDEVTIFDTAVDEKEELREDLARERDARLRLAAEFDNFRRRVRGVREEASEEGKRYVLAQLLPICDDLEMAATHSDRADDAVRDGVEMIQRRLAKILEYNGVTKFESEGTMFDPERHEAFDVVNCGEESSGLVHKQIRAGYFSNGKLLRPSLVIVCN